MSYDDDYMRNRRLAMMSDGTPGPAREAAPSEDFVGLIGMLQKIADGSHPPRVVDAIAANTLLSLLFAPAGDNHHNANLCPHCQRAAAPLAAPRVDRDRALFFAPSEEQIEKAVIDSGGELWRIDELIAKLQHIRGGFGNTCVLVDQLSWGAVAMNRQAALRAVPSVPPCTCKYPLSTPVSHRIADPKCPVHQPSVPAPPSERRKPLPPKG